MHSCCPVPLISPISGRDPWAAQSRRTNCSSSSIRKESGWRYLSNLLERSRLFNLKPRLWQTLITNLAWTLPHRNSTSRYSAFMTALQGAVSLCLATWAIHSDAPDFRINRADWELPCPALLYWLRIAEFQ